MAVRPTLNIAVAKTKNKASEYNENFSLTLDYVDASILESKNYVDGFMPAISSSTKGKFLTNNGSATSWASLGNQPFGDYIEGLIITKSSDTTIGISAGSCYDVTKTIILALNSATTKTNSSQSANSTYYVYIIGNGTNIDFLITTSSSNPTLPSGYTYYRQIGYYTTDADNKISSISTYGQNSSSAKPKAVIIETYINDTSWYIVYSNGWCEQGGSHTSGSSTNTIALLKTMRDTNYWYIVNTKYDYSGYSEHYNFGMSCTTTSISYKENGSGRPCQWRVCGYIAQ